MLRSLLNFVLLSVCVLSPLTSFASSAETQKMEVTYAGSKTTTPHSLFVNSE